jgi:phage shock protein A
MTQARRIQKLEAQVAALRARLDARTDQLLLVLLQIDDLKREIAQRDAQDLQLKADR